MRWDACKTQFLFSKSPTAALSGDAAWGKSLVSFLLGATPKKKIVLLPKTKRANISRPTLSAIEKGSPTVSIGSYLLVLQVLGLESDFLLLAKDDELGRKLQDIGLTIKRRAPKRKRV
jgi:hypothetical protein